MILSCQYYFFQTLVTSVCGVASESWHTDILFTVYNNNRTVWSWGRVFSELVEVDGEGNKTK